MAKKLFRIETEKIESFGGLGGDGYWAKNSMPNLEHWTGDLPNLYDGMSAFSWMGSLTSFTGNIGKEGGDAIAYAFFSGSENLKTFTGDYIFAGSTQSMFDGCTNLKEFNVGKVYVEGRAAWMFASTGFEHFEHFDFQTGPPWGMFQGSAVKTVNMPNYKVYEGISMFTDCKNLQTVTLDSSTMDLGDSMFSGCSSLTNVNLDLTCLMWGYDMFRGSAITSFSKNVESLVEGTYMFDGCKELTSFTSNTPNLLEGSYMFRDSGLTTFTGDLSGLVCGVGMFENTNLKINGILNVCNSLPDSNTQTINTIDLRQCYRRGFASPEGSDYEDVITTYDPNIDIGVIYPTYSNVWVRNDNELMCIPTPFVNTITIQTNSDTFSNDDKITATNAIKSVCKDKNWMVLTNSNTIDTDVIDSDSDIVRHSDGFLVSSIIVDYVGEVDNWWYYGEINPLDFLTWLFINFIPDGYSDYNEEIEELYYNYCEKHQEDYWDGNCKDFIVPFYYDLRDGSREVLIPKSSKKWVHVDNVEDILGAAGIWTGSPYDIVEGSPYIPDASSWNDDVSDAGVLDNVSTMKVENGFVLVEEE